MDNSNSVDLVASTGNADASSPWNGLLQTALQTGFNAGTTALNNALQNQTPLAVSSGAPAAAAQTALAPAAAAPASGASSKIMLAIGALAVVVVVWLLLRKQ